MGRVTADVALFLAGKAPNHGWIVKNVKEWLPGRVRYSSREGPFPPRLVINAREAAGLATVAPETGTAGQGADVTVTGINTSFEAGVTEAAFGPNIGVGGNPEEAFGPVAVQDSSTATASLTISPTAALGPRTVTVRTGEEEVSKTDAFTVLAPGPVAIAETTVTSIAGTGTPGFADGQGGAAQFDTPQGIARDAAGNLYVADTGNHRIRMITPDGTVRTLAGSGTPGLTDGQGSAAQFDSPAGVAVDANGTVYVADTQNHAIRAITSGGTVSTLAGTGEAGFQDGPGASARFDMPRSITLRPDGLLVVGDQGNSRVRLVDPVTGTVSTLAGTGTPGFQDGPPGQAQFASFAGVASDAESNVYVADTDNQRIRKISPDGTVSTVAGTGDFGFADGPAGNAQFADPFGVAVDAGGTVFVADAFNSLIRRITPEGQVETVAGTGARGADDGPGTVATFRTPHALATGSPVFIADTGNYLIRLLQIGPTITCLDPAAGVQGSALTLTVTGTNLAGATALSFLNAGAADPDLTATELSVDPTGTTLTATVTIASAAALGPRVVTVTTPGGTSSSGATAENTFTVLGKLTLTPDPLLVTEGASALLTVTIPNPAPTGGTQVTLESAGPTIATIPSSVTIAEGASSANVTVTGITEGITNITAAAPELANAMVGVNVLAPPPTISGFKPGAGKVGETVTITGTGFRPTPTANTVTFTGPNNTRVTTPVTGATATQLVVTVPQGAATGPIAVTTAGGTATSTGHFIVLPSPDFTLNVAPAIAQVGEGSQVTFTIVATAKEEFTGLVSLALGSLPTGLTASFSAAQIGPGGMATLTVGAAAGARAGSLTITGTSVIDGAVVGRQHTVNVGVLAGGITALTGRVLDTDRNPVQGVTLTLGGQSTQTDAGGNFLLQNIAPGADQFLFIDGSTAVPDRKFPTFPALVTIEAGKVNTLPFTPFLHPQKATGFVDISNSSVERVVTDPHLPGFEMRFPPGVTVTGWDGQPNTKVSVRTVPLDRIPLPHPDPPIAARSVYFLFFDKVGGGTPSQPVPVTTANDLELQAGEKAELWYYDEGPTRDSATQRWRMTGTGTVSADGKTISTDPGVGLPRFCCGAFCWVVATRPDRAESPVPQGRRSGEPVDLATGLFVLEKTDMVLPGRLPIILTRTYRTNDNGLGPFGTGTSALFSEILQTPTADSLIYVQPGNTRIPFARQPDGTFLNDTIPSFQGAKIIPNTDGTRTLRFRDGSTRLFQPATPSLFQLTAIADRNGNTIRIGRDSLGRPINLTAPGGRQVAMSFAASLLQISSVRDPLGREVRYSYDINNRLETVTDPAGGVTRYTYDGLNRLLTITDPRGITFLTNEYSASGRVIRQVQADGSEWGFAYQLSGAQVTGPGCPGPTCPDVESLGNIQRGFTFRGGFVLATTVTDPRGNTTTHRFNNFGYEIEQIGSLGQSTKFERAFGTNLLLSTTDPLGRVTRFTYDTNGNVSSITDPAGNVRRFEYEPTFNRLTKITDTLGNVTQFAYDTSGNLTTITDPLSNVTQIAYNAFGQPISTTDPLGNTTTFTYDTVGNLTDIADPLGNTSTRTYDAVSRLIAQADPRGKTTRFGYDDLNRITEIVDALGGVTGFSYDGNGNLLTVTDALSHTTTHTYDSMDRLATRTDPLNRSESFTYDPNGNLTQFTDRKGQVSRFTYDPLDRRTQSDFADGTFAEFTFDTAGRLIRASDSQTGSIVEEYDVLDRLIRETTPQGTISYAYDALGRRTTMTVDGQSPVSYTYDAASRLRTITQAPLNPVTIDYDALGQRTVLTLPNGLSTQHQYDGGGRLTGLIFRSAAGLLGDLTYQYDPAGNRIAVGGSFARTLLPDPIANATYDAANQQLAFGDKTMTYDANGNSETITDPIGTTTLTWDAQNRLTSLSDSATVASFQYDAIGRRIRKVIGLSLSTHQYDGVDIVREVRGGTEVTYLRSRNIDEPFTRTDTSTTTVHVYLADALGSTLALSDSSGALTTTYTHGPFGRTTVSGRLVDNSFQFTGRENDGTGLYHYRARYYHPALQRFVSEDPIQFASGDTNFYAYVLNTPVNLTDPIGLAIIFPRPPGCQPDLPPADPGRKGSLLKRLGVQLKDFVRESICDPTDMLPGPGIVQFPARGLPRVFPKSLQKILAKFFAIYPKKIGGGGKLEPFDPVSGRYVPKINRFTESIASQFATGFAQGFAGGKYGVEKPPAYTGPQAWGQSVGQIFGALF
ncbi:MAG: RHS repeat-associated core domain-containing protein [Candidatus Methylomirabilales bacterium]